MTDYKKAQKILEENDQEQLLRFYGELSDSEKEELTEQILTLDFSVLASLIDRNRPSLRGKISPLSAMQIGDIQKNRERFTREGLSVIRAGKTAAVLLAGGMGTRLGSSGPKGTYDIGITRHVFIFQCLFENLMSSVKEADTWIHLFIMTSSRNDTETREFIKSHNYFGYKPEYVTFFIQDAAPAVDFNGKILLEEKYRIATSPNGNGGWFSSMVRAGLTGKMHDEGIEWLNVFSVDNVLQKICEPCFIGAVLQSGCASGSKVVRKAGPDEKIGVMCLEDGKPSVVEYIEMTDELRNTMDKNGEPAYNFGVILNYLFNVAELERVLSRKMPLHLAKKKIPFIDEKGFPVIPNEPNGYKFELFILDLIHEMPGCLPYEVMRNSDFAPIKNKTGVDSVESARELCRVNNIVL
ncbi:MAG TPA: UDPGP type 1 family protein [Lachnospiraceae bacterium]|nr:UDPGP type 1 family protein [Lachnospiraceae bacterium]